MNGSMSINIRYICLVTFLALCLSTYLEGLESHVSYPDDENDPWFTGPLLAPSARVVPVGHANLEPYLFYTVINGKYDDNWKPESTPHFYQIRPQLTFKIGLTEKIDFSGVLQSSISWTRGKVGRSFGDLPLGFDYQL